MSQRLRDDLHVRIIDLPSDMVVRDRARRACQRVAETTHPGLAPVVSVAVVARGVEITYAVPSGARAVTRDALVGADDVIRLVAPVAAALAVVHDADRAHGGVRADSIWRLPGGAGVLGPGEPGGSPTEDVRDLVALLDTLLPQGSVGADVAQVLVMGADPDPTVRPTMARIAGILDLARRRCDEAGSHPTSPPAQRRGVPPEMGHPLPVSSERPRARARHAAGRSPAPVGRLTRASTERGAPRLRGFVPRLRWVIAAMGVVVAGFVGLGAVGATEPATTCPAPQAVDGGLAMSPTSPVESPTRSTRRAR